MMRSVSMIRRRVSMMKRRVSMMKMRVSMMRKKSKKSRMRVRDTPGVDQVIGRHASAAMGCHGMMPPRSLPCARALVSPEPRR